MKKQTVINMCISVAFGIVSIAYIAYIFSRCNQVPPTIKEGTFPFRVVYELNGERHEIEDAVICRYRGLGGFYSNIRGWETTLQSGEQSICILSEEYVYSLLSPNRLNSKSSVFLVYGSSTYYMGDTMNAGNADRKPGMYYVEDYHSEPNIQNKDSTPLTEKQLEKYFGIKIIEFEFSKPIKNTFKAE